MKRFLSIILLSLHFMGFSQIDEVGTNETYAEKKLSFISDTKETHYFIDGIYLGKNKVKYDVNHI